MPIQNIISCGGTVKKPSLSVTKKIHSLTDKHIDSQLYTLVQIHVSAFRLEIYYSGVGKGLNVKIKIF